MSLPDTIPCFLCKAFISYKNKDNSKLMGHLNSDHNAFFGMDFLLAGCVVDEDERMAIVNVVKDREPDLFETVEADITLENNDMNIDNNDGDESSSEESDLWITALEPETTLQEVNDIGVDLDDEPKDTVSPKRAAVEFECPECPMKFNLKIRLNRHLKLHTKKDNVDSQIVESKKKYMKIKTESITKPKQGRRELIPPKDGDEGFPCTECSKVFRTLANMKYHFVDIHQPGEFPCKGCNKMYTSKNKMSSHYSRHCNPNNKKRMTK